MAEFRVGTSGWHYEHWREIFYPSALKREEWLRYYARRFDTVEINNSFYRLPDRSAFAAWAEKVPRGFSFAVKASRYITHMKKLESSGAALTRLLENASGLGEKLGPVLFQLPPRWKANASRLEKFVASLPGGGRYAFEFRDESWLTDDIYHILENANCAACIADSPSFPRTRRVTADFVFLRFHGGGDLYRSGYTPKELRKWAAFSRPLLRDGLDVYAYFNNDALGYAPRDAAVFRELLASRGKMPAGG